MAYGDYGGRAYRAGERIDGRCDGILTPNGVVATPGAFPPFSVPAYAGERPYHVLLGDGPVFVGLVKSHVAVLTPSGRVGLGPLVTDPLPGAVDADEGWLDLTRYAEAGATAVARFEGHRLEVRMEPDFFVHVRLTQPDDVVWHGWCGYGVGAGLEAPEGDAERDAVMRECWDDAPPAVT